MYMDTHIFIHADNDTRINVTNLHTYNTICTRIHIHTCICVCMYVVCMYILYCMNEYTQPHGEFMRVKSN